MKKHLRDVLFTLPPEYTGDDNIEKRTICDIAMAHGGKVLSLSGGLPTKDTKDTIGHMSHDRNVKKLAAILRFADELADDRTRTNYLDGMVMQRNTDLRSRRAKCSTSMQAGSIHRFSITTRVA